MLSYVLGTVPTKILAPSGKAIKCDSLATKVSLSTKALAAAVRNEGICNGGQAAVCLNGVGGEGDSPSSRLSTPEAMRFGEKVSGKVLCCAPGSTVLKVHFLSRWNYSMDTSIPLLPWNP